MVYIVGLVEFGLSTHVWKFHDYPDALHQLKILCEAYDEVPSVCPVLLKVSSDEIKHQINLDSLLKFYSYTSNKSPH